jgi:formate hydrogenlyase transcriptional activator
MLAVAETKAIGFLRELSERSCWADARCEKAKGNIMHTMASRVPTPWQPMDLRLAIDSVPALIHTGLPDGYLDFFNQTWLKYVGCSLEDLQGWKWTDSIHPNDVEGMVDKWRASLASGEPFLYEARVRRADGEFRWMLHHKIALRDGDGKIVKWYGSSIDIEDRKQTEQTLRLTESFLVHAQRLTKAGTWAYRPPDICEYWSAEMFQIFGYDPAKGYPPNDDMIARVHPEDRQRSVQSLAQLFEHHQKFDLKYRFIRADGQVRVIQDFGTPIFENGVVTRFVGACTDITEQEQMTQELARSEAYLAEAQRLSHTGSFGWMLSSSAIFWSEETFRIFEYGPAIKPTLNLILERVHPADLVLVKEAIDRASQDRKDFDLQHRLLMPDGSVKHVHVTAHASLDESGELEFVGAISDITATKRAEEKLRRSEAYLADAQRLGKSCSFATDTVRHEFSYWSAEMYRMYEFDPSKGLPSLASALERLHPEDRQRVQEAFQKSVQGRAEIEIDYRLLLADGLIKHLHQVAQPVVNASGDVVEIVGTLMDVTKAKQAEEKIAKSEKELRITIETIPAHIGTNLPDGSVDFIAQSFLDYVGLSKEQWLNWGWMNVIHPEDLDGVVTGFRAALASGKPFEYEQRIRHADGTYRWFLGRNVPLFNEKGTIVKWYGTLLDIEDRKRAELKLRQDEQEFRRIVDAIPHAIHVLKPDGSFLYANQAVLDYTGFTMEEVMAPDYRTRVFHPEDLEKIHEDRQEGLLRGVPFEQEQRGRRRDGEYRWFLIHYNPLRDEQGRVIRWYATGIDIEDRKRAEERMRNENLALREEIDRHSMFEEIVGTSSALRSVLSRVFKVAPVDSTVLITGETGTGKELVARAIHRRSRRSSHAFVSVNCSAIPRDLIASELFGHEKGSFTGALQQRLGRFELAQGGTLFLDEVGELPLETQITLLRVLQEREFERIGGNQPIHADVRVIAATNRDLETAISAGAFRRDLYYRLNVFPIEIPTLSERKEDIPMLVEYFIDRYARKAGKKIRTIDKSTLELLQSYPWPGNIRELQNVIERSVIVCETETFSVDQSWLSVESARAHPSSHPVASMSPAQERHKIEAALAQTEGRVSGPSGAATILGIPASTLESKIRSLKINKFRFKAR